MVYKDSWGNELLPVCDYSEYKDRVYDEYARMLETSGGTDIDAGVFPGDTDIIDVARAAGGFGKYVVDGIAYATHADREIILSLLGIDAPDRMNC